MRFYFEERLPINRDGGICCGCKDGYAHGCGYLVHCSCGCEKPYDVHICLGVDEHYILEIIPEDVRAEDVGSEDERAECFCGDELIPYKNHGCMNYHCYEKRFYYNAGHIENFLNVELVLPVITNLKVE